MCIGESEMAEMIQGDVLVVRIPNEAEGAGARELEEQGILPLDLFDSGPAHQDPNYYL